MRSVVTYCCGRKIEIVPAEASPVNEIARRFDLYPQFQKCNPDRELATKFIGDRIKSNESTIFVVLENNVGRGFVQLYPSFCSVDAVKIYILYDLYVEFDCRRAGLAERLMKHTSFWAKQQGAARLDLLTAKNNKIAQSLYEKLGYRITNDDFYAYYLRLC